jgi:hypothetical protein
MRNLTDRELKAVDKFKDNFNCELATAVSNGMILDMIRYAKRLKLKDDKKEKWTYKVAKEMLNKIEPNKNIKCPKFDIIVEGKPQLSKFLSILRSIFTRKAGLQGIENLRPFIEKGI